MTATSFSSILCLQVIILAISNYCFFKIILASAEIKFSQWSCSNLFREEHGDDNSVDSNCA